MEFRAEYASNIASGAKEDAAGVRALRTELEAAQKALAGVAAAKGPAGASGKPSTDLFGGYTDDKVKAAELAQRKSQDAQMQRALEEMHKRRIDREKARIDARRKARETAERAAGGAGGGARFVLGGVAAAAGIAGIAGLAKLALGYRGMAQLQALTFRTQVQARQLFKGVDPAPAVRAADKFLQSIFSPMSVAGKALAGIFNRVGNGLFQSFEKAQPYLTAFVKGMIIGALEIETAYYDLRLALLPVTEAISGMIEPTDSMRVVAGAGAVAVAGLALAAAGSAAPFILAAAAVADFIREAERLGKLKAAAEVAISSVTGGVGAAAFSPQAQGKPEGYASADEQKAAVAAREAWMREQGLRPAATNAAGQASGKAYADGVVQGAAGGAGAAAAAGGALAQAVDKGFREKGQIHSPSRVAERSAAEVPAGAVRGIRSGTPEVQAAGAAMMPSLPVAGGSGGSGAPVSVSLSVAVQVTGGGRVDDEGALRTIARRVFGEEARALFVSLGYSPSLAAGGAPT